MIRAKTSVARTSTYEDLREWLHQVEDLGEVVHIRGADPHLEVGALTEVAYRELHGGPVLLFEDLKGAQPDHRIAVNLMGSIPRLALTLGLPASDHALEFVEVLRQRLKTLEMLPAETVQSGPVTENVRDRSDVDLEMFPAPFWHVHDGGRYLGTASLTITRDPDTGWVNLGTYRVMVHDRNRLGIYISAIKHGKRHIDKYFSRGEPCPVALCFGQDPLLFLASSMPIAAGTSEFEYAGALRGRPVPVLRGELTGLPIPAYAEIAVEGWIHPNDVLPEGPFGEWTGYYASSTREEPVIQVGRLLYRDAPIITGEPPFRPPNAHTAYRPFFKAGLIWNELDAAGVPDVRGVWLDEAGGANLLLIVSIKQRYPGHARQAGLIASQCGAGITLNRYVIVVDDDIDPTDRDQVLWALGTRSDPEHSIQILHRCFSSALDPMVRPGQPRMHSRAIIEACKPFERLADFAPEVITTPELVERVKQKWGAELAAYRRSKAADNIL